MKKFKLQRYSHLVDGIHRNGSVWLLTSAFIVPFAVCPPGCFLFMAQVTIQKMLPQRRRAWTIWTTKAAQACLSSSLVMFPSSSVHDTIIFIYGFVSPHWTQTSIRTGSHLVHCSAPGVWTARQVHWGFDKHSQPDRLFLRLQATSFFSGQALCLPGCEDPSAVRGPGEGAKLMLLLFRHRKMAVIFTSSEDENYNVAQELTPLSRRPARKFFGKSDLNLSSCGWNRLRPGWSSVGAAGERILCVK